MPECKRKQRCVCVCAQIFHWFSNGTASPKLQAEGRKGIETKYQLYNRVEICVRRNKDIA